jgi:hypothetical protein
MKISQTVPALLAFLLTSPAFSQTPTAKITAWGQHYGGQVLYTYQLQNLGAVPIKRFLIGHSPATSATEGGAQLSVAPQAKSDTFWLTEDVAKRPAGWGVSVVYPEDSSKFSLEWIEAGYFKKLWPSAPSKDAPVAVPGNQGILPGSSVSNLSVVIPVVDYAYVSGQASIDLGDSLINIPLAKGDNVAPQVTLNFSRLNQDQGIGTWAIFDAKFSVTDDFDTSPDVAFEVNSTNQAAAGDIVLDQAGSKAWNVKLRNVAGRTYTFIVRAVDASGNSSIKSYRYSIAP